jgi:hypothetical protein
MKSRFTLSIQTTLRLLITGFIVYIFFLLLLSLSFQIQILQTGYISYGLNSNNFFLFNQFPLYTLLPLILSIVLLAYLYLLLKLSNLSRFTWWTAIILTTFVPIFTSLLTLFVTLNVFESILTEYKTNTSPHTLSSNTSSSYINIAEISIFILIFTSIFILLYFKNRFSNPSKKLSRNSKRILQYALIVPFLLLLYPVLGISYANLPDRSIEAIQSQVSFPIYKPTYTGSLQLQYKYYINHYNQVTSIYQEYEEVLYKQLIILQEEQPPSQDLFPEYLKNLNPQGIYSIEKLSVSKDNEAFLMSLPESEYPSFLSLTFLSKQNTKLSLRSIGINKDELIKIANNMSIASN